MKSVSLAMGPDVVFENVDLTDSIMERMKGLLGRDTYSPGRAMWFRPCSSIHTFFMRFSIDLVFLDRDMKVVDIRRNVPPCRMVFGRNGAWSVLEVSSGWMDEALIKEGYQLSTR